MKLLLTGAYQYNKEQIKSIAVLGYEVLLVQDERVPIQIDVSDIDAVVCNSLFLYNDIKKFRKLKFIQLTSAGLDRVPINYIKNIGIRLYDAKGVYSIPIAEWVVLKILEIYKKSMKFYEKQREHKWEKQRDLLELTDKTAAIIGFGDIGAEVAKRLKAFGVKVIGVGRRHRESQVIDQFFLNDHLDEVLRLSDIVILTLPLTKETSKLIDANKLSIMKDNSVLINVSRGGVIDESALINIIDRGKFLGVALDVFKDEPLQEESLFWEFENVIISPHNSYFSDKVNERLFQLILNNLKKIIF